MEFSKNFNTNHSNRLPILAAAIHSVEEIHDYTEFISDCSDFKPQITFIFAIQPDDVDFPYLLSIPYDPQSPSATISLLKKHGLLADEKCSEYKIMAHLNKFLAEQETINEPRNIQYRSSHTGWICANKNWIYLTAEYGISSAGIRSDCHCKAPFGHLVTDCTLSPQEACRQLWQCLEIDPAAALPIWCSTVLSLLAPLRKKFLKYNSPCLLVTGATQSGKTQLANNFCHFLTNKTGDLNRYFILQGSSSIFSNLYGNLSDTTLLLDDGRKLPTGKLSGRILTALESSVRTSFSGADGRNNVFVITGESNALLNMLESWSNRLVEVELDNSPEALAARRSLIAKLKDQSCLVRTNIFYLLRFLAELFSRTDLSDFVDIAKQEFFEFLPFPGRESDNYLCLYVAFCIFGEFSKKLCPCLSEKIDSYKKYFATVLQQLFQRQMANRPTEADILLLLHLVSQLKVHVALETEFEYYASHHQTVPYYIRGYGNQCILDSDEEYSGIFLEDSRLIYGYPRNGIKKSFLIVRREDLEVAFCNYCDVEVKLGHSKRKRSFNTFLTALKAFHLLLSCDRYDKKNPDYRNRSIDYPEYSVRNDVLKETKVLIFSLNLEYCTILKNRLKSITGTEKFYDQFVLDYDSNLSIDNLEHCGSLLFSLL